MRFASVDPPEARVNPDHAEHTRVTYYSIPTGEEVRRKRLIDAERAVIEAAVDLLYVTQHNPGNVMAMVRRVCDAVAALLREREGQSDG